MDEPKLIYQDFSKPLRLNNTACVYCSTPFTTDVAATKEHVIGRNFVPRGTLAGEWNLIVNACRDCNEKKARLEDDISAITMQPDIAGRHAVDDPRLRNEATRKGKASIAKFRGTLSVAFIGREKDKDINRSGYPFLNTSRRIECHHGRLYWAEKNAEP